MDINFSIRAYMFFLRILLPLLFLHHVNMAQCPNADFTVPAGTCKMQNIQIPNLTTGATEYEWDFCSNDFSATPQATVILNSNLLFRTRAIRIVKEQNNWFGFTIDQASSPNRLIRFEFGASLSNTPTIQDMGNPSNMLNGAYDFRMHKQNGIWYALVANTSGNNILRLTFGSGLQTAPSVQNLGTFSTPNSIFLVNHNGSLLAFVGGVSDITRLNFGNSVLNTPTTASFTVTGGNNIRGIAITRECDKWFGLVTSYSNAKVFWLDFSTDLLATPSIGELTITMSPGYNFPASIVINEDGGEYFAFIQSAVGPVYRITFGSSITDKAGTGTNLGNLGISNENFAQEWVRDGSTWYGFSMDLTNRRLARITLPVTCAASTPTSTDAVPKIRYTTEGTYHITLRAVNADQAVQAVRKTITIAANTSPDIGFTTQNICAGHDVNFTLQNTSGDIASRSWDFGDMTSSPDVSPAHQYAGSGEYTVTLNVTAANGCQNVTSGLIKIYTAPTAGFSMPGGQVCTNSEINFTNSTTDNFDGHLSYQWYLDGTPVSTSRDYQHTFLTTGTKTIRLEASIPGCFDEDEITSNVQAGPAIDFSFSGICEGATTQFTGIIGEAVNSRSWDFDDGGLSSQPDPSHLFAAPGTYAVSLTALSPSGCNNTKTKSVIIRSVPAVDFSINPPPQSCSNTQTAFTNLTPDPADSDIDSWQWNFDDPISPASSGEKSPSHTFVNAGTYNVMLTATTDFGCLRSLQKPIVIAQSPSVSIGHSLACNNLPVNFTSTGSNILTWYWETGTSYYEVPNPVHTFSTPGDHVVKLVVKGLNQCETTYNTTVSVPVPLVPDFSVSKNCAGTDAIFTDVTTGADVVAQRTWDFGGLGSATSSPALFKFTSTGNRNVKLSVTGQSGCSYTATKVISIAPSPVAGFTATPETGASPLSVQFTNTSANAAQYAWTFGDGTGTSTQISPAYIFQQIGEFTTTLTVTSIEGCESSMSKVIRPVTPQPDVDLRTITMSENTDGTLKVIITLQNKGNTFLKDLPVYVDISGNVTLREMVQGPIAPSALYNVVLSYGLAPGNVNFLCATADLQNDFVPNDNRICTELNEKTSFINPYPNPAKNILHVEWVAPAKTTVSFMLVDAFGKRMLENNVLSADGLNHFQLDVSGLQGGIYLLVFRDGTGVKTQKVLISAEN